MDDIFPDLDIDNLDENDNDDVLSINEIDGFIATANKLVEHMDFFESAKCRKLRKALHPLVDNLRKKSFGGTSESSHVYMSAGWRLTNLSPSPPPKWKTFTCNT